VHLTVAPEVATVEIGGQLILSLTIHNASSRVTRFRIDVSGIPKDWYDLDQPRVALAPCASERVHLTVHPAGGAATVAGTYALTVQVTAEHAPNNYAAAVVALTVGSGGWLDLDVQPAEVEGREATFRLTFVNRSPTPIPVRLAIRDHEDRLRFRVEPEDTVIVPAGGAADPITVHVAAKGREAMGRAHPHQLEFRGQLLGSEHTINPYLVGQARFTYVAHRRPAWLRGLSGWAALLPLVVLVLFGAWIFVVNRGSTLSVPGTNLGRATQHQPTSRSAGPLVRTIAVGRHPAAVDMDKSVGHAFVVNRASNTVTMLNTATRAVLRTVAVGQDPVAVAVDSKRGRAFVVNHAGNTVSVLDTTTGSVLHTSAVGSGPSAVGLYSGRRLNQAFVANTASDSVSLLDTKTGAVRRTFAVGRQPTALVVDKTTNHVFVANRGSGTVSMLDASTGRVVRTIRVGTDPAAMAVDTTTGRVFVANLGSGTVSVLDDQTGALLHTTTVGTAAPTAWLTALIGKAPVALGVDTTTGRVFVANPASNTVSVLNDDSGVLLHTTIVGTAPSDVEVDDTTGHVFIANTGSNSVSVLDTRTGRVLRTIPVGQRPIDVVKDSANAQAFVVNRGSTLNVLATNLGRAATT
jgi:YVTN family beta-propeller protein